MVYGTSDAIVTPEDVATLLAALPGGVASQEVEGYAHMDFTWGVDANRRVYDAVIGRLRDGAARGAPQHTLASTADGSAAKVGSGAGGLDGRCREAPYPGIKPWLNPCHYLRCDAHKTDDACLDGPFMCCEWCFPDDPCYHGPP